MQPLITILVPSYNRSAMLRTTLDSLLDQTHPLDDVQIVVSNDNSTDDTQEVLAGYQSRFPVLEDHHQTKNLGPAKNWEFLLQQARGEFVFLLCDDDAVSTDFLSRYTDVIRSVPDVDMILSDIELRDPTFKPLEVFVTASPPGEAAGPVRCREQLRSHHMVMTTMYRADTLRQAGGWDSQVGSHLDCTAFCRTALRARKTFRVESPLLRFRINSGSWSHALNVTKQERLAQWYRRKLDLLCEDARTLAPDLLPFLKDAYAIHAKSVISNMEIDMAMGRLPGRQLRENLTKFLAVFPEGRSGTMATKMYISSFIGVWWLEWIRKITGRPDPYQSPLALFNSFPASAGPARPV